MTVRCSRRRRLAGVLGWLVLLVTLPMALPPSLPGSGSAWAHVGSPEVIHEGHAGPYPILVTVRPPEVVPGLAAVEVQTRGGVERVTLVPTLVGGPANAGLPVTDPALPDPDDPQRFVGKLWLMRTGAWEVHIALQGSAGAGQLSIPVPALALRTTPMSGALTVLLFGLLLLLVVGLVCIVRAGVGESVLPPGQAPDASRIWRSRWAALVTSLIVALAINGGWRWWHNEAMLYRRSIYRPLTLTLSRHEEMLSLRITEPGWRGGRRLDDLLPDHGHLMHLFLIRQPGLDALAHLHPDLQGPGLFQQRLPGLPAGSYWLFADVVHATGLAETLTASLEIPENAQGVALEGDDATASQAGWQVPDPDRTTMSLRDGGKVTWLRPAGGWRPGRTELFRFRVEGPEGKTASDLEPYMGMAGHAMFLARDGSVFAHVHPTGSVSMAALSLMTDADPHAAHHAAMLSGEISFPYAFPRAADYRIFVQWKRHGEIETAVFDATVR